MDFLYKSELTHLSLWPSQEKFHLRYVGGNCRYKKKCHLEHQSLPKWNGLHFAKLILLEFHSLLQTFGWKREDFKLQEYPDCMK